jgi:putative membrane protein
MRRLMAGTRSTFLRHPYAYPALLLALFSAFWLGLAIHPWYRQDWLLENVCVFMAIPVFVFTIGSLRFSNGAYTLLFVFFCLHEVGAHYTYAKVPYDAAFGAAGGHSLNALLGFERNHYDRLIHFLYGVLLLPLARELFAARAPARGVWGFVLPILFIESNSAIFELIEWAAAVVFGGDLGQAYLGTQGDIWDAQWDMLLALLGAVLTQFAMTLWPRRARRREPGPVRPR